MASQRVDVSLSHASADLSRSPRPRRAPGDSHGTLHPARHALRIAMLTRAAVCREDGPACDACYANAAMCRAAVCRTSTHSVSYSETRASVWMRHWSSSVGPCSRELCNAQAGGQAGRSTVDGEGMASLVSLRTRGAGSCDRDKHTMAGWEPGADPSRKDG